MTKSSVDGNSYSVFKSAVNTECISRMQKREIMNKSFLRWKQNKKKNIFKPINKKKLDLVSDENPLNLAFQ